MTSPQSRATSERWIEAEEDDMGLREEELGAEEEHARSHEVRDGACTRRTKQMPHVTGHVLLKRLVG
jgi:hypothetical protein